MNIAREDPPSTPRSTYLKDYRPPNYLVDSIDLRFELEPEDTAVTARMSVRRNPAGAGGALWLDGEAMELVSLRLDGLDVDAGDYEVRADGLELRNVPEQFELEVLTRIAPARNTALEGLYVSSAMFCTQCEAQGFRHITYFPDRPDVMARYSTTILADQARYPVLLSNGNPVDGGEMADGRHWVRWEDPYPKPSYLFALVAGDLACQEARFTTRSGREVTLRIYVEPENRHKCDHALASLQKAMRWDEEVFGREYDLDIYMIVAVNDFNMGAMENKGLNIFNAACVLATAETATDEDFANIQGIIGHEYFHNWSGNRVTCRDWFQLSLKEGFTVFRDQEFSADMTSRGVKRIGEVNLLRTHQFPQDAGPMAHPVRPDSYMEISNFYTVTVYNKGAEVVRMLHTLVGPEGFRRGTDLYFECHDGQAVTTDDFVAAIAEANGRDLTQFKRWYTQAGTPELEVEGAYDAATRSYTLRVRQSCAPTPGQPHKDPFHIPFAVGLVSPSGADLPLRLDDDWNGDRQDVGEGAGKNAPAATRVLELTAAEQVFRFVDVPEAPEPSLLRGFSAPAKLRFPRSEEVLAFLYAHDSDPFNRWDAGQRLATGVLLTLVEEQRAGRALALPPALGEAFAKTLREAGIDAAFKAQLLTLPSEAYLAEQCAVVDVEAIHAAREFARRRLAEALREPLLALYDAGGEPGPYRFDAAAAGRRRLKNLALAYLMTLEDGSLLERCTRQYHEADNMTERLAALSLLADTQAPAAEDALRDFHDRWRADAQVVDKWFAIQARSRRPDTLARVQRLLEHPDFHLTNPNRVRALVGAFCQGNPVRFHAVDGGGYRFLAERILELDPLNPQMAARLVNIFSNWRRYDADRQALMREQLQRILEAPELSKDSYEIASKSLAAGAS